MGINKKNYVYVIPSEKKITKSKITFCDAMLFFLGGLYIPKYLILFVPIWIVSKILSGTKLSLRIKNDFLIVFFVYFIIFSCLWLGKEYIYLSNPNTVLPLYICIFLLYGYIFSNYSDEARVNCISFFVLGMFLNVVYIACYNYIFINSETGYGHLFNPITKKYINSPAWSLMLALAGSYFILLLLYVQKYRIKLIIFILFFISIFFGFYLGGRAFFVIYALSITLFLIGTVKSFSKLLFYSILLLVLVSVFTYIIVEQYPEIIQVFDKRFEKGLESPRFSLWKDGFHKMIANPFGGFTVDQSIDNVRYFHNFWLDTARVSGLFPVVISLSLISLTFVSVFLGRGKYRFLYTSFSIVCLALMFQDVIVEGAWRILFVFYLINIGMLSKQGKVVT